MAGISKELLEILICPKCGGDIYLNDKGEGLVCDNCSLIFKIKEGIPVMIIDKAVPLGQ